MYTHIILYIYIYISLTILINDLNAHTKTYSTNSIMFSCSIESIETHFFLSNMLGEADLYCLAEPICFNSICVPLRLIV